MNSGIAKFYLPSPLVYLSQSSEIFSNEDCPLRLPEGEMAYWGLCEISGAYCTIPRY